jgi:hypothetical protein
MELFAVDRGARKRPKDIVARIIAQKSDLRIIRRGFIFAP